MTRPIGAALAPPDAQRPRSWSSFGSKPRDNIHVGVTYTPDPKWATRGTVSVYLGGLHFLTLKAVPEASVPLLLSLLRVIDTKRAFEALDLNTFDTSHPVTVSVHTP